MESGFGDFLRQLPLPLIGFWCLSGVILIGAVAAVISRRAKKRQQASTTPVTPPSAAPSPHEMPDLDILTTPMAASVSEPAPANVTNAAAEMPSAAPLTERPSGTARVTLTEGSAPIDAVEVLVILRDVADGALLVRIGDKVYRNPPASADPEFKRRFNLTMRELAAGTRATLETAPPAVPATPTPEAPTRGGEMPATPPPNVPLPGDLPKFKLPDKVEVPPRRGRKAPPKEVIPEINIAGAIESYLQHKLAITQMYPGRSIHVRPAAHGGVQIEVDGNFYESVSDVEDADARSFIAATIEEWQSRQ